LVFLDSEAFADYQNATGGVFDDNTGLLRVTSDQLAAMQNLDFAIGGVCCPSSII
jgi:cathepsin E